MPTAQASKPAAAPSRTIATPQTRRTRRTKKPSQVFTKYVGTLRAKPQARQKMSLGIYSAENPAKGYSIKLKTRADIDSPDIQTKVVMNGSAKRYELVLYLNNDTGTAVSAEVWQI